MNYYDITTISKIVGLFWFMGIFIAGCVYAFRPSAKSEFEHAARLPFEEEK